MKTLIKNGRIVTAVDDYKADILIEGEITKNQINYYMEENYESPALQISK